MDEIIETQDKHYILATSPRSELQTRVLKYGETFAVFDRLGDIPSTGLGEAGLYHEGTRYLSRLRLRIEESRPFLLSSTVRDDNALLTVDLANPDIYDDRRLVLRRDTVHVFRGSFLWKGRLFTRLRVRSFSLEPITVSLEVSFDADFVDVFEVRGEQRPHRGRVLPAVIEDDGVDLSYEGLDGVVRRTRLRFSPVPKRLSATDAEFELHLPPGAEQECFLAVLCVPTASPQSPALAAAVPPEGFDEALDGYSRELQAARALDAQIVTSNGQFNAWLRRSASDLHLLITPTPFGPYPYAGIPWYSTVFGRDGIIAALEYLWINPQPAAGVLRYLAANQADRVDPERDAQPGKILHEVREGEMADLGEIPFGRYYGSVDATPLFVVLAGAYYKRTADRELIAALWPNIRRALDWIDQYGDADGDGFVEYARQSSKGLATQGWKDSVDSVFHADGALAQGPTALCEVQGYVYAAWRAAAGLAEAMEDRRLAAALSHRAESLRRRFEETFWCEDLSTYAIALDGEKRLCRVRTSNAGQCLMSGIASHQHALGVARTLLDKSSFSGWGIRTVADTEVRYNPMSYHDGSVWPHDNALIAYGLARYGLQDAVLRVLDGLFDASQYVDLRRMPELVCGFVRRPGEGPTLYPVACAPQAWSAGAVFLLLKACLGMTLHAARRQIRFHRPALPQALQQVTIKDLRLADASVDLAILHYPQNVGVNILRREGNVEVVVVK